MSVADHLSALRDSTAQTRCHVKVTIATMRQIFSVSLHLTICITSYLGVFSCLKNKSMRANFQPLSNKMHFYTRCKAWELLATLVSRTARKRASLLFEICNQHCHVCLCHPTPTTWNPNQLMKHRFRKSVSLENFEHEMHFDLHQFFPPFSISKVSGAFSCFIPKLGSLR